MKSCLSCGITLVIMGVLATLLWHFLGRPDVEEAKGAAQDFWDGLDFGDFTDVLDNFTDVDWGDFLDEDPYVGDNTTNAWATRGEGLTLELQNALDDNWQTEFEVAMADWQESTVLTLTTTRVEVDHTCARVDGVMLVCNGNFGETGWVGINEVEIEYARSDGPGFIISSVAKMNEFYLNKAAYEKRRYTMCHEIGHGFGLPHTDENPNNSDLGNCLDYTNTPENNQLPGDVNFNRLIEIYIAGGVDSNAGTLQDTKTMSMSDKVIVDDTGGRRDRHGRYLRRVIIQHFHPVEAYDL